MEKIINKLMPKLYVELAFFFFIILTVAVLGVTNVIPNGLFTGKDWVNTAYVINVVAVAVLFIALFLALRLLMLKTVDKHPVEKAVKIYHKWSLLRLSLLLLAIVVALVAYFLTLEDSGLFCAAVLLLITVICCIPSKRKLTEYVDSVKVDKES